MADLERLQTESVNPRTTDLDQMPVSDVLRAMNAEDATVAAAVGAAVDDVAQAVDAIVAARSHGGRLVYVGAGTSGRLGVLDASECPPTFGVSPDEVVALIAGGREALTRAVEGTEDDPAAGERDLRRIGLRDTDVVVGLAASGRTPYVVGALDHARAVGAIAVAVSCNPGAEMSAHADIAIEIDTGPEVLTGSTRLKAGTAQKLVCNMLTTATMVRSGKVHGNLMVDLTPTNSKLVDRAARIVAEATGVSRDEAADLLARAGGHAKTAIVMQLAGLDAEAARIRLERAGGYVREAIG